MVRENKKCVVEVHRAVQQVRVAGTSPLFEAFRDLLRILPGILRAAV